ncbi:MAG: IS1634 family transposase [Comamonadaceae bacterium]|jgi:transposase|uniref:IS1634 family transposase n=1 Tax=Candidatus Skiveiella danica TaxID=3386177 RepID=UPI00390C3A6B|nr:IS1634 family transposase [Comamonadaceae bacterium]
MHINIIPNRGSPPTVLLRESYREGGKVHKRTLANLSALSSAQVQMIRATLRGDVVQPVNQTFEVIASPAHGHVQAVCLAMQRLDFASMLAAKPCRERDLVLAMVASRIISPATKLATTRLWRTNTLAQEFGVSDANEDDLYAAMDWLLAGQDRIQKKLAARHLKEDCLVLYDLSSSYFEGSHCPLAKLGYSRDGKRGTLQVNYGLLTDDRGCPVAISVHDGNTSDSTTFIPQVTRLREKFGLKRIVMVGDRGMISQKAIDKMSKDSDLAWITALRSASIRALVEQGRVQMGLFDERNLLEISSPDFPGERLIVCRNPELAKLRVHTRNDLLLATEKELVKIQARVESSKLVGKDKIGLAAGKVVNRYKVAKHFELTITDAAFTFARLECNIAAEAALDGLYIIRTSVQAQRMDAPSCVRTYKSLAQVERAFRSIKTMDLKVRPIHHHLENRVRAHIFLCMLAYYVEWHMRQVWRELMFCDEDQATKLTRDPVAPAKRSNSALKKVQTHTLEDGTPTHSFQTLMTELQGIVRNTCRTLGSAADTPTFEILTTPNSKQKRALELIAQIKM